MLASTAPAPAREKKLSYHQLTRGVPGALFFKQPREALWQEKKGKKDDEGRHDGGARGREGGGEGEGRRTRVWMLAREASAGSCQAGACCRIGERGRGRTEGGVSA